MANTLKWLLAAVLVGFAAPSPAAALEPPAETAIGPAATAGQQNVDARHAQAPTAVAPNSLPAAAAPTIELPGRSCAQGGPGRSLERGEPRPDGRYRRRPSFLRAPFRQTPSHFAINGGPYTLAWLDLGTMGLGGCSIHIFAVGASGHDRQCRYLARFTDLVFIVRPKQAIAAFWQGNETPPLLFGQWRHRGAGGHDSEVAHNKRLGSPTNSSLARAMAAFAPRLARRLQEEEGSASRACADFAGARFRLVPRRK